MSAFTVKKDRVYLLSMVLIACISSVGLLGQATGDPKEDFLYGEYYVSQGLYQKALPFYLSALEANPDNNNINYRIGLCYLRTLGVQLSAVSYLEKAVLNIDEHYVEGRYKNEGAPIEAWLLLGDAYHRENELEKASRAYHEYRSLIGDSDREKYELVMRKISGLGISYEFQREDDNIKLINLGPTINTRFSDYNPVVSGDQRKMIYTQFWESYDRILCTELSPSGWTKPKDISVEIGSQGICYTVALSYNGDELYLVCHELEQYDLFVSFFREGIWSGMIPLPGKVNSHYRESSAGISSDGSELYFASDRPGGEGGFDIYRAKRKDGEWTDIENLGDVINTDGDEEAPFITASGTELYLSSNGSETIGNMDILVSELNDAGNWSEPKNIGSPMNTTNDDIFYLYFGDTETGYISRDLPEGFGKNDIYIIGEAIFTESVNNPVIDVTNGVWLAERYSEKFAGTDMDQSGRTMEGKASGTDSASMTTDTLSTLEETRETDDQQSTTTPVVTGQVEDVALVSSTIESSVTDEKLTGDKEIPKPSSRTTGETVRQDTVYDQEEQSLQIAYALAEEDQEPAEVDSIKGSSFTEGEITRTDLLEPSSRTTGETVLQETVYDQEEQSLQTAYALAEEDTEPDEVSSVKESFVTKEEMTDMDLLEPSSRTTGETVLQETVYDQEEQSLQTTFALAEKDQEPVEVSSMKESSDTEEEITGDKEVPEPSTRTTEEMNRQDNVHEIQQQTSQTTNAGVDDIEGSGNTPLLAEDFTGTGPAADNPPDNETGMNEMPEELNINEAGLYPSEGEENDSIPTYTIQIYALLKPIDKKKISLSPVIISPGEDGLHRYTWGEFIGYSKALELLDTIRNSGYPDAFIRNISTVQNYKVKHK